MNLEEIRDEFKVMLQGIVDETGIELKKTVADVANYASKRAEHLSLIIGQPGFEQALQAERDSVALYAGVAAAGDLDKADLQLFGFFRGALALAAKVLAAAAV